MNDYDVIVCGAGPAGATAAYFLSKAGKRVMIMEKQSLPRYKPCGGGLSLQYLKTVFPFSFEEVIDQKIDRIQYHYGGQKAIIACRPDVMAMVMRDQFDHLIIEKTNCVLLQNEAVIKAEESDSGVVISLSSGKKVSADHLIAADGANSIIRRSSGLHRKQQLIAAIEAEIPLTDALKSRFSNGPIFIFDEPRAGYSWIFPKKEFLSVGIGVLGQITNLRKELIRIMTRYGISLEGIELHGHPIPVYDPDAVLSTRRILLVGDAAGLADPFSGEGIRPAIKSGQIAAMAIINKNVEGYTQAIYQKLGRRNKKSLFLWKIFIPLRGICLFLGAPNPFTTDAILKLISDDHSSLYVAGWSFITMWYYVPVALIGRLLKAIAGNDARLKFMRAFLPGLPLWE